jgi:putative DNA methylase
MTPADKCLSIDSSFDSEFADRLARYETYNKHHYRPNTYLHKWWGRRCGSTFRLILKGLVEDPQARDYYTPGGLAGKVILDPMMGGGTTLHEAIRLGASVIGVDVDPIPVLQARATLTGKPLAELQASFDRLYDGLAAALGDQFRTHCPWCDEPAPLWYALYGLRQRCDCRQVIVVDSLTLRHELDDSLLRWCPQCGLLNHGDAHHCSGSATTIVEKNETHCPDCGGRYREPGDRPFYARYEMMAVAGHCPTHSLFHKSPDWRDREALARADERRARLPWAEADFCVEPGDKSNQLLGRNVHCYLDLFSSRQLAYLDQAARLLPNDDPIVRLNMALLLSTALEFNSMLCGYKGNKKKRAGAVRHTFAYHGYSFPYTALENNPIYPQRASGTLQKLFHSRIARGRSWAAAPTERRLNGDRARVEIIHGETDGGDEALSPATLRDAAQCFFLWQGTATRLPVEANSVDAVVTDPPYFDSIQYGDLAAFFRVWLRQFLPESADWRYDGAAAAVTSERDGDARHYTEAMGAIFRECRRVLVPERGRLIFTFHHWQPRAWASLTAALHQAGFVLLNRYVVHAEHLMSVHINNVQALTHDAILILAPRPAGHAPRWETPPPVTGRDSYHFTEYCATFLGCLLDEPELSEADIKRRWHEALPVAKG